MMYPLTDFEDVKKSHFYKKKTKDGYKSFSDEIYTFDIETTSLFKINGKWQLFDKKLDTKAYKGVEKRACVYHCQFSVNDKVYFFYYINQFEDLLKKISNPLLRKIIYVHNLSYETGFLQQIMDKYTITDMCALDNRQPIRFVIEELNIEFRCSYKLTQLSLEKAAEEYTDVKKAVGDLDYNVARSPLSAPYMTEQEKYYCEMDCVCLYHIIKHFRDKYNHVALIPLTQTGTVRKAIRDLAPPTYFKKVRSLVPTLDEFNMLKSAFFGGITHGNRMHCKKHIINKKGKEIITSVDISSSYPFVMCTEKFPCTHFRQIEPSDENIYDRKKYCFIYVVRCKNVKSIKQNNFLSSSKCINLKNPGLDNGRVNCADELTITLTDVDYDMLQKCYEFEPEMLQVWVAKKDYLPKFLIDFILDSYSDKTRLKKVKGMETIYNLKKINCNCIYGISVTDLVKSSIVYDKGWICGGLTEKLKKDKLDEQKNFTQKPILPYSTGVFVTAYARRNLFERILEANPTNSKLCSRNLDYDVVYYDTDSLKMFNFDKYRKYFENYNERCKQKIIRIVNHYGLDIDKFYPYDKDGICHPLGYYDFNDGHYSEFCTLGAKRYAYRDLEDGELHITVSGVNKKSGAKALKDNIKNFKDSKFFDYDESGKNTKVYYDHEEEPYTFTDNMGNEFTDTWSCGVVLQPTTYKMSLKEDFSFLIDELDREIATSDDYIEIRNKLQARKKK